MGVGALSPTMLSLYVNNSLVGEDGEKASFCDVQRHYGDGNNSEERRERWTMAA